MTEQERKTMEMALEALEMTADKFQVQRNAITELRQALDKPEIDPQALVQMAVLAEREACAKLCEEILEPWLLKEYIDKTVDAIRARGEK